MPSDQPDKVVRITLDETGLPVPDQDPVPVWRGNQKVRWCADFEFQITIEDYTDVKYSTGNGTCAFAAKTGYFEGTSYKYTIHANGRDNDPTLEIKP